MTPIAPPVSNPRATVPLELQGKIPQDERAGARRTLAQNLLLLTAALLAGLALAELLARALLPPARSLNRVPLRVSVHERSSNPKLLYKPAPHALAYVRDVLNTINSAGFRDREFPVSKPAGVERIVFLGDSVVYGFQLRLEDSLPKRLEKRMQASGKRVEVLNLGVSGYESQQQVEFFKDVGLAFSPDVVLVGYTLNDSKYASWELDEFNVLGDQRNSEAGMGAKGWVRRILAFLYGHSQLAAVADERLRLQDRFSIARSYSSSAIRDFLAKRNTRAKDPEGSPYRNLEAAITDDAERLGTSPSTLDYALKTTGFREEDIYSSHWNVSKEAFLELAALGRKHAFRVIVVIFPIAQQDMKTYPLGSLHAFLGLEFRQMGFGVIDLEPFVRHMMGQYQRLLTIPDGMHFSPKGALLASAHLSFKLCNRI